MTPLPMARNPGRQILKKLPSGQIVLEQGADGVYLRFECDCLDALPYCQARCCAIHGIELTSEEAATGKFHQSGDPPQLNRRSDGYCIYNDHGNCRCTIYKDRPGTCRDFHCTRGPYMRGWRLELNRLSGGE